MFIVQSLWPVQSNKLVFFNDVWAYAVHDEIELVAIPGSGSCVGKHVDGSLDLGQVTTRDNFGQLTFKTVLLVFKVTVSLRGQSSLSLSLVSSFLELVRAREWPGGQSPSGTLGPIPECSAGGLASFVGTRWA